MARKVQFEVLVNTTANRLTISIHDCFERLDTASMERQIRLALKRLSPGFTVLTVIGNIKPVNPETQVKVLELMKLVNMGTPSKRARVVSPLINIQMNRILSILGEASRNFESVDDAIAYLDEKDKAEEDED